MAKRKTTNEDEGPAPINPIYEPIVGEDFQVDYGPLQGRHDTYVRVLKVDGVWLYVQPLTENGKDNGPRYWLQAGHVTALIPMRR